MRFSQRQGILPVEKAIQRESIDDELRNSLWSLLKIFYWDMYDQSEYSDFGHRADYVKSSNMEDLITRLWLHFFKQPVDTIHEYFGDCVAHLRDYFFSSDWFEVYDYVEFIANNGPQENRSDFIEACNSYLERENAAYRFVNNQLTEITSQEEIQSIEEAISNSGPFSGVRSHIESAIQLMSDRKNPDYRNSIKESISAVESLCNHLVGEENATLGAALKRLEQEKALHPALKSSFSSLYGYTSDAEGIRHALMRESSLEKSDARFMLVSCSAFINYAIDLVSD